MKILSVSFLLLGLVVYVQGHMSIYVPSMWGSEPTNENSNWAVQPLQDLMFVDWWMHGTKSLNDPPAASAITQLPAGGTIDFEITGNKAFTSMGHGLWTVAPGVSPRLPPDPWSNDMHGGSSNIHAPTHADVAGCALGIAYKSDVRAVNPPDFVIFSVVRDCIARQLQAFDVPALPACPNGKCICAWFWIHNSTGGTDQMYMTPFQCNVTNPSKRTIGTPVPPVRCDGKEPYPGGPVTTVCKKPLQPMYWKNQEKNNMLNPGHYAPTYAPEYGFPNGAQNQIFTDKFECLSGHIGDTLISTSNVTTIHSSSSILASPGCNSYLSVEEDGNVVLKDVKTGKSHWSSGTSGVNGVAPYHLTMEKDGNLVLYDSLSSVFWSSETSKVGCSPHHLKVRDVLSLRIVDCNGEPIWTAKTI
jgi:hypothetical protein